jgi:predicted phosphoribosyltransferase
MLKALVKLTESTRGQKAFRADPSTVPDRKIGAPEDPAVAAAMSSGTDTVMETKPSAGDDLRKNVVRTEMDKQAKSDGLAE